MGIVLLLGTSTPEVLILGVYVFGKRWVRGSLANRIKLTKGFLGAFILAWILDGILHSIIHLLVFLRLHLWVFLMDLFWSLLDPFASYCDRVEEVFVRNFSYVVCVRIGV